MTRPATLAATLAVAAGLLSACQGGLAAGCAEAELPSFRTVVLCEADQRPDSPTLAFPLVGDPDTRMSIDDLDGRYVVLNFWGEWCGPCRVEQPALNAAAGVLDETDVAFLGVAIQSSQANQQAFRDEFDVPYPSLFDQGNELAAAYGGAAPKAPPSTFVLDRRGRKAIELVGGITTGEIVAAVELLMEFDAGAAPA